MDYDYETNILPILMKTAVPIYTIIYSAKVLTKSLKLAHY
jgi:hypothetical protein